MAKKDNKILIIAIIALVVFAYGGNQGWFKSNFNGIISGGSSYSGGSGGNGNTPTTPYVTLSIQPTNACVGDTLTGTIQSNLLLASCSIQYRQNSFQVWQTQSTISLNSAGYYSTSQKANAAGTMMFRVVCVTGSSYATSNEVAVVVNNCNNNPQQPLCTDSDNGQIAEVFGSCNSAVTQTGNHDTCEQVNVVKEYYCKLDNTCDFVYKQCNLGWWCVNGQCSQMQCNQIHPGNAADCDAGYCANGFCNFVPATLVAPAKCECGIL